MKKLIYLILLSLLLTGCSNKESTEVPTSAPQEETFIRETPIPETLKETAPSEELVFEVETELPETELETHLQEETDAINVDEPQQNWDLNGRGSSDSGRTEPKYINLLGYIAIGSSEDNDIKNTEDFSNPQWMLPIYEIDESGSFSAIGEKEHKTKTIVLDQLLEHTKYGRYVGYLLVRDMETDEQYYIDVKHFITKPYWEFDDLASAVTTGSFLAEYHQLSNNPPVTLNNDPVDIEDGTIVFICGKPGLSGNGPDTSIYAVHGPVFKEWVLGYGPVSVAFDPEDLTIIY